MVQRDFGKGIRGGEEGRDPTCLMGSGPYLFKGEGPYLFKGEWALPV